MSIGSITISGRELRLFQRKAESIDYHNISLQADQERRYNNRNLARQAREKAKLSKWFKSIEGMRQRKQAAKFKIFEQEEKARQLQDEDEQAYQQALNKQILFKANKQLFENNQKLLMCDVNKERQGQVKLRNQIEQHQKQRDQMYNDILIEGQQLFEDKEAQKAHRKETLRQEQNLILRQQLNQTKENYMRNIQDDRVQGEVLKLKAQEDEERERERQVDRRQRQLRHTIEMRQHHETQRQFRAQSQQRDRIQDERIEEYHSKKENIRAMRKRREDIRNQEKLAQYQSLSDAHVLKQNEHARQNDYLLEKAISDTQTKNLQEEIMIRERKVDLQRRCQRSLSLAQDLNQEKKVKDKQSDSSFQDYWTQKNRELQSLESKETSEIRSKQLELTQFHLQQVQEKNRSREETVVNHLMERDTLLKKREDENTIFEQWAQRHIVESNKQGKNVRPLIRELNLLLQR